MRDELPGAATFEAAVATLCHDARGPIQTLLLQAELVARTLPEMAIGHADRVRLTHAMAVIARNGRACADLLAGMLDARPGAVPALGAAEPFCVRALVAQLVGDLLPAAAEKGLTVDALGGGPVPVCLPRSGVARVLANLIDNAVKYTADGGVEVSAEVHPGAVVVRVADTGCGVPAADAARIFEPYARAATGAAGGYGLGLYSARRLARAMGGDVTYQCREGGGSCFSFCVPAGVPQAEP